MTSGKEVAVPLADITQDFDDVINKYFNDDEEID